MNGATVLRPVGARGWDRNGSNRVAIRLGPAGPGTGIVFNGRVRADVSNAHVCRNATGLGRGRNRVCMVEHLLAACLTLGITDLAVETSGGELPLFDGSAAPYDKLLRRAGRVDFGRGSAVLRLARPIAVRSGPGRGSVSRPSALGTCVRAAVPFIAAFPSDRLRISCLAGFPGIGAQFFSTPGTARTLGRDVIPARTFGPSVEPPQVLRRRLHLGFGLRKTAGFIYPLRWRFPEEPCRHKMLDLVGDLALLGRRLRADVFAFRPGHGLNLEFVRILERRMADDEHRWDQETTASP